METQNATTPEVNNPVTARSVGLRHGLILGLVSIIFSLILILIGDSPFNRSISWVNWVFVIALVVIAHKRFKDGNNGYMSYGQGVGISFWISLASTVLGGIFLYIYITAIDPGLFDAVFEQQIQAMEEKGMPDDQIEMGINIGKMMFWPMYLIGGIFCGVLIGLIVSIFTQKKAPEQLY